MIIRRHIKAIPEPVVVVQEPANEASVFINTNDGKVYTYDPISKSTTFRFNSQGSASGSIPVDIAHTNSKVWISYANGDCEDWNMTLDPFRVTFSRMIFLSPGVGSGLCAMNSLNLVAEDYDTTTGESWITKYQLFSGTTVVKERLFSLGTATWLQGDIIYNPNDNIFIMSVTKNIGPDPDVPELTHSIRQYSYAGVLEKEITISNGDIYGMYVYDSKLYGIDGKGVVHWIEATGLTGEANINKMVYGANQLASLSTFNLNTLSPPEEPDPTLSYQEWYDNGYRDGRSDKLAARYYGSSKEYKVFGATEEEYYDMGYDDGWYNRPPALL